MSSGIDGVRLARHRHRPEGERPAEALLAVPPGILDVGQHPAGAEHRARDLAVVRLQLVAQRVGERDDAVLHRLVDASLVAARDQPAHRGGVDDVRLAALRAHARQEGVDAVERPPEVHREHPLPVEDLGLLDLLVHRDAGVVEQQVRRAELRVRAIGERLDLRPLRDVRLDGDRLAAPLADRGGDDLGRFALDVGDDDAHALVGALVGERPSDAVRRAGHDGDPIPKLPHRTLPSAPAPARALHSLCGGGSCAGANCWQRICLVWSSQTIWCRVCAW